MTTFADLGVSAKIEKILTDKGYIEPTPIQEQTIPLILGGRDLIGQAETGSGKTAACAIPCIQQVDPDNPHIQVLILTPTRELCVQYLNEVASIGKPLGIIPFAVYGGFEKGIQKTKLQDGVHILVATTGRLIDIIYSVDFSLEHVRTLIVDEADEMLDMGFLDDVEFVKKCLVHDHQTLLFSATMPPPIKRLATHYMKDPLHVNLVSKQLTPESLEHFFIRCHEERKTELLIELLNSGELDKAIIFCNTRVKVGKVYRDLRGKVHALEYLHGGLDQKVRTGVIEGLRRDRVKFVVTTDVMARGLDFRDISHIIHFDLPHDPEIYIHRSGRCARQGRKGSAIAIVGHREGRLYERIVQRADAVPRDFARGAFDAFAPPDGAGHRGGQPRGGQSRGGGQPRVSQPRTRALEPGRDRSRTDRDRGDRPAPERVEAGLARPIAPMSDRPSGPRQGGAHPDGAARRPKGSYRITAVLDPVAPADAPVVAIPLEEKARIADIPEGRRRNAPRRNGRQGRPASPAAAELPGNVETPADREKAPSSRRGNRGRSPKGNPRGSADGTPPQSDRSDKTVGSGPSREEQKK